LRHGGSTAEEALAPWTKETDDFALLVKANWQFAVDDSKQFRPLVFWANACIIARFLMHFAVAC